ncbi:hypothetical protein [Alkalihalobacillus sp. BA299]|uniref:hypothetical protein n=1 Tax=Alkalihalobacillus sp. BA299 TaxID=2815938 RepID=UPI001ADC22FF|nr:hypothetical protein [Alkalihalobacillus sp. BA299]
MNEFEYRALAKYKQENIKKVYQEVNRGNKVDKKERFNIMRLLMSLVSKKKTVKSQHPCCKTQCCPTV